jgi:hypothetical protein
MASVVEQVTGVSEGAQRSLHPSDEQIWDDSCAKHPETAGSGALGQSVAEVTFGILSEPLPPPSPQPALERKKIVERIANQFRMTPGSFQRACQWTPTRRLAIHGVGSGSRLSFLSFAPKSDQGFSEGRRSLHS